MLGDPRLSLAALAAALDAVMSRDQRGAAQARARTIAQARDARLQKQRESDQAVHDAPGTGPALRAPALHMARFMEEFAPRLPGDAIIFDEALTNSPPISRTRPPVKTGQYFLTRGGSLGVGIPGAIGAKLAHPDKTVIGFTGDGGAMYTIQALWTAARHNVAAKFVICNNSSYRLLQLNVDEYWKTGGIEKHDYPLCFDLSYPPLRFDEMARSMGVPGVRVEKPWEIKPAITEALAHPGPFLIDLVLEGNVHPERVGNTCGQ